MASITEDTSIRLPEAVDGNEQNTRSQNTQQTPATPAPLAAADTPNDTLSLFDSSTWGNSNDLLPGQTVPDQHPSINATDPAATPPQPTGRGRGRGRGRGPRTMNARGRATRVRPMNGGVTHDDLAAPLNGATPPAMATTRGRGTRGRSRGRGSRGGPRSRGGRGGRRRRSDSDEIRAEDSPSETESEAEDDDGGHPTATRSGRSVQKPHAFAPEAGASSSGVKRPRLSLHHRGGARNVEFSVCKVCSRPHSPASNMIVFCDGCNTPYHRYCHRPAIEQLVVDMPEKEWYCAPCEANVVAVYDVAMFRPAEGLGVDKIRSQLSRLPSSILVDLLLQASSLHPDIPVISAPHQAKPLMLPPPLPPQHSASPLSAPPSSTPAPEIGELQRPPDNELESGYESDPPAHYPLAGQGLAATLPPESEHEAFLVDDNAMVYTHVVQQDAKRANEWLYGGNKDGKRDSNGAVKEGADRNGERDGERDGEKLEGAVGNGVEHDNDAVANGTTTTATEDGNHDEDRSAAPGAVDAIDGDGPKNNDPPPEGREESTDAAVMEAANDTDGTAAAPADTREDRIVSEANGAAPSTTDDADDNDEEVVAPDATESGHDGESKVAVPDTTRDITPMEGVEVVEPTTQRTPAIAADDDDSPLSSGLDVMEYMESTMNVSDDLEDTIRVAQDGESDEEESGDSSP